MASPYLLKRRSCWYLRIRIPTDLKPWLGVHLTRTLKTRDLRLARQRANLAVASLQTFWPEARKILSEMWMGKPVDEIGLDEMHQAYVDRKRAVDDFEALSKEAKGKLGARIEAIIAGNDRYINELREAVTIERYALDAFQKGIIAGLERAIQASVAQPQPQPVTAIDVPKANSEVGNGKASWNAFVDDFFAHQGIKDKTQASYRKAFARFDEIVKGKALGKVSRQDVQKYRDELSEIQPRNGRPAVAAATIQKNLSHLKTYFGWCCIEQHFISENPASLVTATKAQRNAGLAVKRLPYSKEELQQIFDAPLFSGCLSKFRRYEPGRQIIRDDKFWLPLLALFTGARMSELTQLTISDVVFAEGHDCISINLNALDDEIGDNELMFSKKLKNGNAVRIVPIHPILKKIGLMEYVQGLKKAGKSTLFSISYDYSKFWNETFLHEVGIKKPSLSFHSFRHTYKRAIRVIGNVETQNRLMGHQPLTIGEVYGGGLDENEAKMFLDKFNLNIDLSHLYQLKI